MFLPARLWIVFGLILLIIIGVVWGRSWFRPGPVTMKVGSNQPLGPSDAAGFCAPIEIVQGDSIFLIVSVRSPRKTVSWIQLQTNDRQGRSFTASGRQKLEAGVNRLSLSLEPEPQSAPGPIAWPLEVVQAYLRIPGSDEEEGISDARWGSLAFIYPDHVVTPAAPTETPTPP